jgi:hypothetical protein
MTMILQAWMIALCALNTTKPTTPDWQLVARSDAIVSAEVSPSSEADGPSGSGRLDLRQVHVIVGRDVASQLTVSLHGLGTQDAARVRDLKASRAVAFLGAYDEASEELQLAGDPASAFREFSDELVKQAQEVARANESAFLRAQAKRAEYCRPGSDLQRRVHELVGRLSGGSDDVAQAIEGLLSMGREAVPCVVCELEGAREAIPVRSVRVSAGKGALEGYAHYTPEEKVDLLDLVLTSATGVSFGSIVNGATSAQRERAIRGWWVYLGRVMSEDGGAAKHPPANNPGRWSETCRSLLSHCGTRLNVSITASR